MHSNKIRDADVHFTIDPITRAIKNTASTKTSVIQYDHNSERFTFMLPRHIEGHDMMECNRAEVHYINASDAATAGVYIIEDMQTDETEENVLCSWLLSQNATQQSGVLHFLLRFACVADDGEVEYAWNTGIHKGISVASGMFNSEEIAEKYADVLAQWERDISAKLEGIDSIWQHHSTVTFDMPLWANQPKIATLTADGSAVDSLRDITAEDLTQYNTTDIEWYRCLFIDTTGKALPNGCFRVVGVPTTATTYNTDFTTVFYLDGYKTGAYTLSGEGVNAMVDFVLGDDGIKRFRKAGDIVTFDKLPIDQEYKIEGVGFVASPKLSGSYQVMVGYMGMYMSKTKTLLPNVGSTTYSHLTTYTNLTDSNSIKVGNITLDVQMELRAEGSKTLGITHIASAKDKVGTGLTSVVPYAVNERRIAKNPISTNGGVISLQGGGVCTYMFLNGTTIKLYSRKI